MIFSSLTRSVFSIALVLVCAIAFNISTISVAEAKPNRKYASIVMDADTGAILHQRYADKQLHPASLTKMMTLLLTFEQIEAGKLRLSDRVFVSKRAASMVPSKLNIPAGSTIRVQDAIKALVTKSANDIAVALAEKIAGTEWRFAQRMTHKARQIGMSKTTFRNASGLHHSKQVSTARDMAILSRYLIKAHPRYYKYFSLKSFKYRGVSYRNHNKLLRSYKGMDGLKTGYIAASGFNLASSAVRNDRRIIGVVFGGRSGRTRNSHMVKLLNRGFAKLDRMRIAGRRASKVPVPAQKPRRADDLIAFAKKSSQRVRSQYQTLQKDKFENAIDRAIGLGDFDPDVSKRFETGLLAMAAHTGRSFQLDGIGTYGQKTKVKQLKKASTRDATYFDQDHLWSIQVGAFTSPLASDIAIRKAVLSLPNELRDVQAEIKPVPARTGTVYRARVLGFDQASATRACSYLPQCLIVAPKKK